MAQSRRTGDDQGREAVDATGPASAPGSRFRRFSPANGWSGFITELVIVVLGILIALGTQQAADGWKDRRDVAAFRRALNAELAFNLAAYQTRAAQSDCVVRRLDQLEQWQREWQDGDGPAMSGMIGRPLAPGLHLGGWRSGGAGIAGKMPLEQRLNYTDAYDSFELYDSLRYRELDVWLELFAYDSASRLSPPEVNKLRGLILMARSIDRSMTLNLPSAIEISAQLEVKPEPVDREGQERFIALSGLCAPLAFVRR